MPPVITSPHNPRVRHVAQLRERRHRTREGLLLVEGHAELALALASGSRPQTVYICPELQAPDQRGLPDLPPPAEMIEVSRPVFEKMAYRENPDGWLAVVPIPQHHLESLVLSVSPLLVVAESVEKPGNLGAILRSADAAGAEALIVCDPATDPYNPNVVRASKGALFSLAVLTADSAAALAWLRTHGLRVAAATPAAELSYTAADLRGPLAIAVGTEKEGLTSLWLREADLRVRIPMRGRVNSLNVATATALLLYEAVRQRG